MLLDWIHLANWFSSISGFRFLIRFVCHHPKKKIVLKWPNFQKRCTMSWLGILFEIWSILYIYGRFCVWSTLHTTYIKMVAYTSKSTIHKIDHIIKTRSKKKSWTKKSRLFPNYRYVTVNYCKVQYRQKLKN